MFTGTLSLHQGNSFSYNGIATDYSGTPLNLSGVTGGGFIKIKYGDSGILDSFNFNITNPASGNYNLSLSPAHTSAYPVGQGIYGVYVFTSTLNEGPVQSGIAQGYINIYPELIPTFTGLYTGVVPAPNTPSPSTYFGSGIINVTGNGIYVDALNGSQGIKTTRMIIASGLIPYTGVISLSNANAFAGATLNYILNMPISNNPYIAFNNATGNILTQPPLPGGGNVFLSFGFDGSNWQLQQWV